MPPVEHFVVVATWGWRERRESRVINIAPLSMRSRASSFFLLCFFKKGRKEGVNVRKGNLLPFELRTQHSAQHKEMQDEGCWCGV